MRTEHKNNNDAKKFSVKAALERYIEKNASFFEKNDLNWNGRLYGRY